MNWGEWILKVMRTEPERIADPAALDAWQARLLLERSVIKPKRKRKAKVIPIESGRKAEDSRFTAGQYRAMFRGEE